MLRFCTLIMPVAILLISCTVDNEQVQRGIRVPGEFEEQSAIWMGYRAAEMLGYGGFGVADSLAQVLHRHVPLKLIVEHDSLLPGGAVAVASMRIDTNRADIIYQHPTDFWYRDPGPVFCLDSAGNPAIVDFEYSNYANLPPEALESKAVEYEKIDEEIAARFGYPTIEVPVHMEGGAFETNGQGTVIQVEAITLERNPHLSRREIESHFEAIGIEQVIWLPRGLVEDPLNLTQLTDNYFGFGTGGHTDEFVRFAGPNTILLAWVDEHERRQDSIAAMNHRVLSKNYEILSRATDVNGNPFKVIKVPTPSLEFAEFIPDKEQYASYHALDTTLQQGDPVRFVPAKSYLNYVITNGLIVLPAYYYTGAPDHIREKDARVKAIFHEVFPDRKIVQLDPRPLNYGGGGMHCIYQPEFARIGN